ncbi:MAG: IS3 family transposase, partial [Patescibacteria group bacterium]
MAVKQKIPYQSKKELAKELGISRASLYYKSKMTEKDLRFKAEIEIVMEKNKAYGHKRIAWALDRNKKKVLRVMKKFGLKPKRQRKAPRKPQDQNQAPMAVPNLIQGIIIEAQDHVWVSDFTFLPYFGKFVYLATVEDLFTREIIGWEISFRHNADLVAQALLNATSNYPAPQIIHSDQGSEYRSHKYQELLRNIGIKQSMSKKASPWQ